MLLSASAEGATAPTKQAAAVLVIRAGRLIDVATGQVLRDQAILIDGEYIKEVGPAATVARHAPTGAREIDLWAATVAGCR